jgi:hypothetical protein
MTWNCPPPRQTSWPLNAYTDCILQGSGSSGGSLYGYGLYGYGLYGYGSSLPGNVTGQCQIGPQVPHTWWTVTSVVIATASVNLSTFYLYRNSVLAANLVGTSLNGNADSVAPGTTPLTAGEILIGVWLGGDNGVQASMVLLGTISQTAVASGVSG